MYQYLNISNTLEFIDDLVAIYEQLYNQHYDTEHQGFSTISDFLLDVEAAETTTYLSKSDSSIYWQSDREIEFFLDEMSDLHKNQDGIYLNNYVQNIQGNRQYQYCGNAKSDDVWVSDRKNCPDGYRFIWRVQPVWTKTKDCYSVTEKYEITDIQERYKETPMYQYCQEINDEPYYQTVLDIWSYANTAFNTDEDFNLELDQFKGEVENTSKDIYEVESIVTEYYLKQMEVYILLQDLQKQVKYYEAGLDCSYVKERTEEMRLGFCGDYVHAMFYSGISLGGLGICNIGLSFAIILVLFRYRTNLEIEREDILRRVGRVRVDPPQRTMNEVEAVQKEVDTILESTSRDGMSRATSRMVDSPADFEEDNNSFFGDYMKRVSKQS